MKCTVYLRVAENPSDRTNAEPIKVAANSRPNYRPLQGPEHWGRKPEILPTAAFAVELDIPDEAFRRAAEVVASLDVPAEQIKVAAEVAA